MASQTKYTVLEVDTGDQSPPSSSATPRRWWSRPIVTLTASNDRPTTFTESIAFVTPCCTGIFTVVAFFYILLLIDQSLSHAKFSIQSIAVSPSDVATWHVDFLVNNPSTRYSMYYDGNDASVRLGPLNAAVLNISRRREARDVTVMSLAFAAEEGSGNDVVSLGVKLRAMHKRYVNYDEAGHLDVRCQNLTRSHENVNIHKIICQSSFTPLERFW
ncbi:unnamed protein product [Arabis nemorensis]|uniref:Late embryogenesis abundant protein LEA-2 subgroup domain-containing protein n=1 Tax=Arabis nemorensis TaxID=586526 RepID=A0A565CTL7_9BRAS|nr:unnamed protein product [Arabis nemorensis]